MTVTAQIFALCAILPSLALIVSLVRRGSLRIKYVLVWVPVAVAMLAFTVIPSLLESLASALGVAYPPTVIFVLAIGLLIFVAMHLSWELSRLDERVRALAEHIAITAASQPEQALDSSGEQLTRAQDHQPASHAQA